LLIFLSVIVSQVSLWPFVVELVTTLSISDSDNYPVIAVNCTFSNVHISERVTFTQFVYRTHAHNVLSFTRGRKFKDFKVFPICPHVFECVSLSLSFYLLHSLHISHSSLTVLTHFSSRQIRMLLCLLDSRPVCRPARQHPLQHLHAHFHCLSYQFRRDENGGKCTKT